MAKKHEQTDDYGYKKTDEQLNELEDRLSSLYAEASHDMEKKLGDFLSSYEERDKQKRELLEAGKITEEEYQRWRVGQIFQTKKMQAQIDSLTQDLVNTDKLAMQMVNGELPSIYATNYNFQGFKAETVTDLEGVDMASFSIYNADAVARLAKKNPDLLPAPKVDIPKDMKWNKTKINTAISQGIIQGEPINKIAARLQQVTDMDYNAAIRNARTAVVGAQNAGRKDASERITKNGVPMIDVWSSTYDGRTRDTHIALNGQERDEDGYFHTFNGDKLEYPCDPKANPAEVYNCRCRLNSFIKGIDHSHDDELYDQFMQEQYFDTWMSQKEAEANPNSAEYAKKMEKETYKEKAASLKEKYPKEEEEKASPASFAIKDSPYTPCTSIADAEAYAKDNFVGGGFARTKDNAPYKNIDLDVANACNQRLTNLYDNFNADKLASLESFGKKDKKLFESIGEAPMSTSNFGNISLNNTILKDAASIEAYAAEGQKSFEFVMANMDSLSGKQLDLAMAYKEAGRSLVDNSVEGMLTHEFGHFLSYGDANEMFAEIQKAGEWTEYASHLSGYANHSFGEYVAESFTAYYNGEYDLIQPEMKDIFDSLRK